MCCEAFYTIPIPALLVEMGQTPLSFGMFTLTTNYSYNLRGHDPRAGFSAVVALLWALHWVDEAGVDSVVLCSDSSAALHCKKAKSNIVEQIFTVLYRLNEQRSNVGFYGSCWQQLVA